MRDILCVSNDARQERRLAVVQCIRDTSKGGKTKVGVLCTGRRVARDRGKRENLSPVVREAGEARAMQKTLHRSRGGRQRVTGYAEETKLK